MSQSPPGTLGKYQIIREIARSNDIVYEAYDPVMNRRVAVKELAMPKGASGQQQEERLRRFHREARAAGSLVHPNIVTVYEVSEDAGRHYIAMEYLDGQTLRNELDTHGFVPPARAVEVAIEVLEGLEFAHSKGVIHRDIKPENIQILSNGQIKLTDFGIARLTFEPNLTMDGQVFGTPSYMSPEQINGREIDARSDIFSVGVILYEMVAGQKPFTGDSVVTITYAIMNKQPDQPQAANFALWQTIERAIDKSPTMRFGTAQQMIDALTQVESGMASGSVVLPSGPQAPQQPWQGTPQPPPVQSPYGASQIPYPPVPYGQPISTPYGQQPQAYPGAQQVPYQPQTGQPYGAQQQPYVPIPIYYPPPPRKPLLSPGAKSFIGRLILAIIVVVTLFAGVVVVVNSLAEIATRGSAPQGAAAGTSGEEAQAAPREAPAPVVMSPEEAMDVARDRIRDAVSASSAAERQALLEDSARIWGSVVQALPGQGMQVSADAARSFMDGARLSGDPLVQRQMLYHARGFAAGNPELERRIETWLAQLGV